MSDEICLHEHAPKETFLGIRTEDRICSKCGARFYSAGELEEARAAASAAKKAQLAKEGGDLLS